MRRTVLLTCAALLLAGPAYAQGKAPNEAQVAARYRAEEGLALFKDGRWEDAYAAFAEADRIFHAPTLVSYMGTCRRNQGRLVEARALFEKVAAEPVPKDAPEAFRKAVETARAELEKLRGRIALLKVNVVGAEGAAITVDGAPLSASEAASGRAIDPGEHKIAAEAPGLAGKVSADVKEGDAVTVEVRLAPVSASAKVAPDRKKQPGSLAPAVAAFSVGGAGIVLGAVTGLIARSKVADAQAGCTPPDVNGVQHCPAGNESAAGTARALIATSAAGFIIGGIGAVAGTVFAVARPGGAPAKVSVDVGPASIVIRGRF